MFLDPRDARVRELNKKVKQSCVWGIFFFFTFQVKEIYIFFILLQLALGFVIFLQKSTRVQNFFASVFKRPKGIFNTTKGDFVFFIKTHDLILV